MLHIWFPRQDALQESASRVRTEMIAVRAMARWGYLIYVPKG